MPRPWAYFDTSVLMKRYLEEDGAAQARVLLRRHRLLSSTILPVEAVAVLGRRREARDLSEPDHAAILGRLQRDRVHWELVDATRTVLARAEQLAGGQGLRALDALHVASALEFETSAELRVPFLTADRRQRAAAERAGLGRRRGPPVAREGTVPKEPKMTRPALFVVKATITPELEETFNQWYNSVRSEEAARVPGCIAMRRYAPIPLEGAHAGSEPWRYMVCYEFDSEESLRAFVNSDTLRAMTKDYNARFGGAGERARLAYRQIYP